MDGRLRDARTTALFLPKRVSPALPLDIWCTARPHNDEALAAFACLPRRIRGRLLLGTLYRITTFALGAVIGAITLIFAPLFLFGAAHSLETDQPFYLSPWITLWLAVVGGLWLGSVFIGAWYNVSEAGMTGPQRSAQLALAVAIAPIAGILESCAGLSAVVAWCAGRRSVQWLPTPKTSVADTRSLVKADYELGAA